jgi:ferritin-like metal-binding protein YciE
MRGARDLRAHAIDQQVITYLMDAHAVEEQALGLLRRARRAGTSGKLSEVYEEHLDRAELHRRLLEERLHSHNAEPSALKDAAMRLGASNWSMIFHQAHPVTPARATALMFALTHLKIAGYDLLRSIAMRAEDQATVELTDRMLAEERATAVRLSASFDDAVEASLDAPEPPGSAFGGPRRTLALGAERASLGSV